MDSSSFLTAAATSITAVVAILGYVRIVMLSWPSVYGELIDTEATWQAFSILVYPGETIEQKINICYKEKPDHVLLKIRPRNWFDSLKGHVVTIRFC